MNLLLVRRLATVLLFVAIPSLPVRPQDLKPNSNPEERSRKIKPEIKKAYTNWINDVSPILTP